MSAGATAAARLSTLITAGQGQFPQLRMQQLSLSRNISFTLSDGLLNVLVLDLADICVLFLDEFRQRKMLKVAVRAF